jgi:hypothetical protein
MTQIDQIDQQLTAYNNLLIAVADTLSFMPAFEFDLHSPTIEKIPFEQVAYSGLYFIELKNSSGHTDFQCWAAAFVAAWTDSRYKQRFVPNPKKGRVNSHKTLKEWVPLYIGKSRDISKRLWEHIHLPMDKPTYALKLKGREHLRDDKFKLSTIKIEAVNYDWIMPVLERALRDKFNPIIGRQ